MKLTDIINQLKAVLPRYTNDFSTSLLVTSLTRSSSTVTATTATAHGLVAGNKVLIVGAKTPITISSLTNNNGYAMAICATKHNLTPANTTVEISGADQTDYNGTHNLVWRDDIPVFDIVSIVIDTGTNIATVTTSEPHGFIANANFEIEITGTTQPAYNKKTTILSVPTTTTFTYTVYGAAINGTPSPRTLWQVRQILNAYTFIYEVSNSPTSPATGTITQIYQYQTGYNGYKTVLTAPTTTTFTYTISTTPNSPAQGTISAKIFPTITGSISYDRAVNFYETYNTSGQSSKWIVCVLSDENTNKNNKNLTDAVDRNYSGEQIRMEVIQSITLYIFLPCGDISDELLYIQTRDLAESYKPYIFKAILGLNVPSDLSQPTYSKLLYTGNGYYDYNSAYYVHQYSFQAVAYVNQTDAIEPEDLSAFRSFDFDVIAESETVMNINGEVDQEV